MKVIDYTIISDHDPDEVERVVGEHLGDGWFISGTVVVVFDHKENSLSFHQGMVKLNT